jgi:hypothetical protein
MKNAAVATTTASGAAVSRRRMTAVQSVYIAAGSGRGLNAPPSSQPTACRRGRALISLSGALLTGVLLTTPAAAGVVFENCQTGADGSLTCDTRPTGDTAFDDEAARYGLLDQATPGWAEYNPYEGDDEMFGDNWT